MTESGLAVAAATAASPFGRVDGRELGADEVLAKAALENFPVALTLLPPAERRRLEAIYGYARLVDDAGDLYEGDRAALLDWIEADLDRAYDGRAEHPLLQRLSTVVRDLALPREPFLRLLDANRQDQVVSRYSTWADLAAYCDLSANPVGELVLHVFDAATPERIRWSDAVCTGLQLAEHWQDVGEDLSRGRIYLPQEDLSAFRVAEADLASGAPSPAFRELMTFEVERARGLLAEGLLLVASLSGRHRLAVAGYVGGGRAALDAVERSGFDVLRRSPRAGGRRRAAATMRVLREAR
jgi:squalene synthase HpnC